MSDLQKFKERRVLDEEFKLEMRASIARLTEEVTDIKALISGGKMAASMVRWLAAIAVGCAGAYAWVFDNMHRLR